MTNKMNWEEQEVKKFFLVMVMMAMVGCSKCFLRAGQAEQDKNQAQAALREEFRSEKIYRILEEKGIYYVVKLKTPDTAITEKDKSVAVPPKAVVPDYGGKGEAQTQSQTLIKTYEEKPESKSEMPKGAILGGASSMQAMATSGPNANPQNFQLSKTQEHSKEAKVFSENIKRESHVTEKSLIKRSPPPTNRSWARRKTGQKPLKITLP